MAATERMVLDAQGVERALARVTHEILERNKGVEDLVFIGVRSLGVEIAERLAAKAAAIEGVQVPSGVIDITLYRDDLSRAGQQPAVKGTDIPFPIDGIWVDQLSGGAISPTVGGFWLRNWTIPSFWGFVFLNTA